MRLPDALRREPWAVLAPLVVLQWLAVGVYALTGTRNGWLFYQGGDQTWFYTSARVLADGHVPETFVGYAWAFVLAPIAALAGPNFLAALPVLVVFQFLVLLPVALLAVYGIASRIGGRMLGYFAAALWIVLPFAAKPMFVERYEPTWQQQVLPQMFGLTGLGDFPSMVVVLVAAYFFVRSLETRATADVVACGLATGLAIGIKPSNGLFVAAPLAGWLVARHWRAAFPFAVALLPALVTLAIWKARGSGIPLLTFEPMRLAAEAPYYAGEPTFWERLRSYVPLDREQLNNQFLGFREYFWSARLLEYLPVAGAIAVARRSVPQVVFLATWLAAFFVIKGSSPAVNVESGSIWRLLMPAYPAYVLLMASIPLLVPRAGIRLAERFPTPTRPFRWRRPLVLAPVAAVFAVPLLVLAVLPSAEDASAAKIPLRSLFLPVDSDFAVTGAQTPRGLRLTWRAPGTSTAETFYVVLRSPLEYRFPGTAVPVRQGIRCHSPGGAIRCSIEMDEIARTRQRLFFDLPPVGAWTYRIGVASNWLNDPSQGDILVVSPPVNVSVR